MLLEICDFKHLNLIEACDLEQPKCKADPQDEPVWENNKNNNEKFIRLKNYNLFN